MPGNDIVFAIFTQVQFQLQLFNVANLFYCNMFLQRQLKKNAFYLTVLGQMNSKSNHVILNQILDYYYYTKLITGGRISLEDHGSIKNVHIFYLHPCLCPTGCYLPP